jgi:hypothetical protein
MTAIFAKLDEICAILKIEGGALQRIHVSEAMWDAIAALYLSAEPGRDPLSLQSVPVIVDAHYKADWWSEHYNKKAIFHMGDHTLELDAPESFLQARHAFTDDPGTRIASLDAIDGIVKE